MSRTMQAAIVVAAMSVATPATAQSIHCYQGSDYTGAPAEIRLQVQQFVTFAEIYGVIQSRAIGTMQLKADFASGAGRAFYRHEYEGGAVFINFTQVSPDYSAFVLDVQDFGRYPFTRTACR